MSGSLPFDHLLAYRDQELTLHRNGEPEQVWMNLDYSPVPDETGRPVGVIAIVVETTERMRAERRQTFRLQLEERLRSLADPRDVDRIEEQRIALEPVRWRQARRELRHRVRSHDFPVGHRKLAQPRFSRRIVN